METASELDTFSETQPRCTSWTSETLVVPLAATSWRVSSDPTRYLWTHEIAAPSETRLVEQLNLGYGTDRGRRGPLTGSRYIWETTRRLRQDQSNWRL